MIKPLNLPHDEQVKQFEKLLARVETTLERYGRPFGYYGADGRQVDFNERGERNSAFHDSGDFLLCSDYWGYPQVLVSIGNLSLLRPNVIAALREHLHGLPDWEIVIAVALDEHLEDWPEMGLFIRQNEIIDGLQRQYFPPEFRDIAYKDGRPGTQDD